MYNNITIVVTCSLAGTSHEFINWLIFALNITNKNIDANIINWQIIINYK